MFDYIKYFNKSDLQTLELYLTFYNRLKTIGYDPISIEFQILTLKKNNKLLIDDDIKKFSREIMRMYPQISLDRENFILRILPNDYIKILNDLENNLEFIEKLIQKHKSNHYKETSNREAEIIELSNLLKKYYDEAPDGYQMTFLHLFGIKYQDRLKKVPIKRLTILATGKESLYVEISKGMKLHDYVEIIKGF